jgi:menaquinone-dependent protoporphyrinogen IX oxidase
MGTEELLFHMTYHQGNYHDRQMVQVVMRLCQLLAEHTREIEALKEQVSAK